MTTVASLAGLVAGCGPCQFSSIEAKNKASFTRVALTDSTGTTDLSPGGAGLDFSMGLTGAGDGHHYEVVFYAPYSGAPPPDAVRLDCAAVTKTRLVTTSTIGLATFCGCAAGPPHCVEFDVFHNGAREEFDLSKAGGTVHVVTGGDPSGPGTTRVTFDVPDTTVTTFAGTKTGSLAITALTGMQTRNSVAHPGSCGGGGNGIATYRGWRPGGG